MITELNESQQAFLSGLRDAADFLARHPNLIPSTMTIHVFPRSKEEFVRDALSLGTGKKMFGESWVSLARHFGPVRIEVSARREDVCKRVVVGTVVNTYYGPAPEAVEALPKTRQEVVTEKVEWVCPPSLLSRPGA